MSEEGVVIPQIGNRGSRPLKDFKRAYMACIPCRKTKAKCERDPDAASQACIRCRRERRECIFTSERSAKKRKKADEDQTVTANTQNGATDNTSTSPDTSAPDASTSSVLPTSSPQRMSELFDIGQQRDQLRNSINRQRRSNASIDNDVMRTVVSTSKDALGLLFKAAEQAETDDSDEQQQLPAAISNNTAIRVYDSPASALTGTFFNPQLAILSNPSQEILKLWNQHRFVRQGWFSAREAVTYVDLFFKNLACLSPIVDAFFADHNNHKRLILEEPLLCCTILMISSRYHILPGQGGLSRADFIHIRVWRHTEHLIQRITFGMEKYSIAKSRTLGSVTALLLITEWHPKALHFPPENDGWDASLAPSIDDDFGVEPRNEDSQIDRWREDVFEPAKRSDRMSWMLLGMATTLAHELDVFESPETETENAATQANAKARLRIRRLLFLYVNQLALRLGCTSFLPQSSWYSIAYSPITVMTAADQANHDRDLLLSQWIDITKLLKTATDMFFPSKSLTRQILKSGRYVALLEHFQPLLLQWYKNYSAAETPTTSDASRHILFIDYSYVRMYINSLAIQAIVERTMVRQSSDVALNPDILHSEYSQDFKFISEVVTASRDILSTAVRLGNNGNLRYCPVRIFLRIVSASIFLLKAISLGARNTDVQNCLETLEQCIQVLKTSSHDDIHLSARYGTLIARHVRRFKRNFRVQNNASVAFAAQPSTMSLRSALSQTRSRPQPLSDQSAFMVQQMTQTNNAVPGPIDTYDTRFDQSLPLDDWLAQPFDPSIAPFGLDIHQSASGLEMDSLDFLWNLAT